MSGGTRAGGYKDLIVWQRSIALVTRIYEVTAGFPADERFGLIAQMRRAAVSVPSNIAEGQARHTTGEFIHGISHAEGSAAELETQLVIAVQLGFCAEPAVADVFGMLSEVRRMLNSLRRRLADRH